MSNVFTFPTAGHAVRVTPEIRAQLEEVVQHALEAVEKAIAVLDRLDGLPGLERSSGPQLAWSASDDSDFEE